MDLSTDDRSTISRPISIFSGFDYLESDQETILKTHSQSQYCLKNVDTLDPLNVPYILRKIIICVLFECINELNILKSINMQNDFGMNSYQLLTYASLEDRYMRPENHAEFRINSKNNNFDKLAKDINMLHQVLLKTCKELGVGTYHCLVETVEIIKKMHKEEEELLEEEANRERVIKSVKNKCEKERQDNIKIMQETNEKIQQIKYQAEDINIYGQLEVQYFEEWEKTRKEQNYMKCQEEENSYKKIITDTEKKIAMENRCHEELVKYFKEVRDDCLDEIEQWMKKYNEETEELEDSAINLKNELEKITEERKLIQHEYEKQQTEINDWLEYKRIKEAKELQRQKEIAASIKIQAWWRGIMVRKHLGPYSKKKKKKGKDAKKKKKGKKLK
ncbi:hypothetical protein ABEB36_009684 [Hypothenemus hampei]|uniref:Dynein regulatory complex protein 9 n=1 Tax=Hypothenemus hampei TaxID=57062 RepID=A0ABD1EHM6_HYPHA